MEQRTRMEMNLNLTGLPGCVEFLEYVRIKGFWERKEKYSRGTEESKGKERKCDVEV